jgi:hypothetical protein
MRKKINKLKNVNWTINKYIHYIKTYKYKKQLRNEKSKLYMNIKNTDLIFGLFVGLSL